MKKWYNLLLKIKNEMSWITIIFMHVKEKEKVKWTIPLGIRNESVSLVMQESVGETVKHLTVGIAHCDIHGSRKRKSFWDTWHSTLIVNGNNTRKCTLTCTTRDISR